MSFDLIATLAKMSLMLGIFILGVAPIMLWVERRMSAYMQDRPGPNRLGPLGLVQGVADAVKFMFKEDVTPAGADKPLYLMAPALALLPALSTYVVIPFGPDLVVSGKTVPLIVSTGSAGVLIFLALSSLGVYSLITAGYASNNKFSLLGGIRASAQLISYELALTVAVLAALIPAGSFYLPDVVAYQRSHIWMVIPQAIGFLVFLIAMFAETNRLPFDLPEAESELIAGFHTEYGAMRFATFFMAEYISMTALSMLCVTLYFGGWTLPGVHFTGWLGGIVGLAVLLGKVSLFMLFYVWVRWTFPRFRYDQLMRLGWKVLLPLAILNLLLVAIATLAGWFPGVA